MGSKGQHLKRSKEFALTVLDWLRAHRPPSSTLWVVGFYAASTIVVTFPFILHPGTTMIGPTNGDVAGSVATYQATIQEGTNPFTTGKWTQVAAPVGAEANVGVNRVSFLSVLSLWLGSLVAGPIAAHSLQSFLGYLLTAIIAFVFVRRVTGSVAAGAVAGFVFGFSPHMLAIARAAPAYTHMWLLLLPLVAFWSLADKGPNRRRLLLAALSVVPAVFWSPYFMLHACVVGGTCLAVTLIVWWRSNQGLRRIAVSAGAIAAIWLVLLGSYWYIGTSSPSTQVPMRTTQEAYDQSAHPLMYALPGHYSVWGGALNGWLSREVPRAFGTNSYVGLSALILGAIAVFHLLFNRKIASKKPLLQLNGTRVLLLMAGAVAIVCLLFSLPPKVHIGQLVIPTPNGLVVEAVPALRAGQRFVMPMMGAVAVMAGIGAYALTRMSRPRLRAILVLFVPMIIILDIWALPPQSATTVPSYPSMAVLARQPKGLTAQYQSGSIVGAPGQFACILQIQHRQPLINDCTLGRPANNLNQPPTHLTLVHAMPLCGQLPYLRDELGARYIIAAKQAYAVQRCAEKMGGQTRVLAADNEFVVIEL